MTKQHIQISPNINKKPKYNGVERGTPRHLEHKGKVAFIMCLIFPRYFARRLTQIVQFNTLLSSHSLTDMLFNFFTMQLQLREVKQFAQGHISDANCNNCTNNTVTVAC